jgi:hypothetical protein
MGAPAPSSFCTGVFALAQRAFWVLLVEVVNANEGTNENDSHLRRS